MTEWLVLLLVGICAAGGLWLWRERNLLARAAQTAAPQANIVPRQQYYWEEEEPEEKSQERPAKKTRAAEEVVDDVKRESTRLGIIILRWLKQVKFNDKSLKEVLEAGTAEDKEELRGIVGYVIQLYEGLAAHMISRHPALANGQKMEEGFAVAKVFKHAINILVALEAPSHMAAASKNIGAGITSQPERWNELQGESVDRLMQTIKNSLEDAFGALELRIDSHERAQAEATEQVQDAMEAEAQKRKRRRKKQSKGAAQQNAFNQRRNSSDLNGDGIADRHQGLEIRNPTITAAQPAKLDQVMKGIGAPDADALKAFAAGNSAQAKQVIKMFDLPIADVSHNDKLSADIEERDAATRIIELRKRERTLKDGSKTA
jgi:hypothetical protein